MRSVAQWVAWQLIVQRRGFKFCMVPSHFPCGQNVGHISRYVMVNEIIFIFKILNTHSNNTILYDISIHDFGIQ